MIAKFVERFNLNKEQLAGKLQMKHPEDYAELVRWVIEIITEEEGYVALAPDPDRVHVIDDGDCRGTLVFVVAEKGYQPSDYWYVLVDYGSCCGCDTLQAIKGYDDDGSLDEQQVKDYLGLALNVVQGLKLMRKDI